jgi:tagaturonate reductase
LKETVLQFGAGNFLRGFVDTFLHEMNEAGQQAGKVVVVQSTGAERAAALNAQGARFHLVVRGLENGAPVDRVQEVGSISRALVAAKDWDAVLDVARSPGLRAVVSNTTEAGLVLEPSDAGWPERGGAPASFPAKLLAALRARFQAGQPGLLILPCELIEDNADRLRSLILEQAALWGWADTAEPELVAWLGQECVWANNLVDRIVSGKPAEHPLLAEDTLLAVAEPYQFWAVESKPGTEWLRHPAIHLVPDVRPFALRKVRILNGAHSALVSHVRRTGRDGELRFVREAVADPEIGPWLRGLLFEEIVPTVADRVPDAEAFAHQTLERFANPFLDHKLSDIALHHDKKVAVRLVPTRDEYRAKFGRDPARLAEVLTV